MYMSYYVSNLVPLPPLVAQAAYDDLLAQALRDDHALGAGRTRLVITGPSRHRPTGTLLREVPVLVRSRSMPLVGQLELNAWSHRMTELGIRPTRWRFGLFPPESNLRAAHRSLTVFRAAMLAWAEQPLREVLDDLATVGYARLLGQNRYL